jgi:hypothetical protein
MSSLQEYVNVVKTLYINLNLRKKSPNEYRTEIKKYREYRLQNKNDPGLQQITNMAVNDAIIEYKQSITPSPPSPEEEREYIKVTKKLYTQLVMIKADRMNYQNEIIFYQSFRTKYANYENLKKITDDAVSEAISEYSERSNQTLMSQTSNPLTVLKQAIIKNYKLKLDKKIMNNTALDEIISESDRNVDYFKQRVKPEDLKNVEEKALFDFLVIIVRQYINPIKEEIKKIADKITNNLLVDNEQYNKQVAKKDMLENEINDYISKNSFLADKRQEIETLGNDNTYVILEGFRPFQRVGVY